MRNKTKVIFALIVGIFTYRTSIAQNAQSLLEDGTKKTVDTYQYKRARDLLETNSRIVESLRNSGIGGSSATFKADTFNH